MFTNKKLLNFEEYVDLFMPILSSRNNLLVKQWLTSSPLLAQQPIACSETLLMTYLNAIHQYRQYNRQVVEQFFDSLSTRAQYRALVERILMMPLLPLEKTPREKRCAEDDAAKEASAAGIDDVTSRKWQKVKEGRRQLHLDLFPPTEPMEDDSEDRPLDSVATTAAEEVKFMVPPAVEQDGGGQRRMRSRPEPITTSGFTPV